MVWASKICLHQNGCLICVSVSAPHFAFMRAAALTKTYLKTPVYCSLYDRQAPWRLHGRARQQCPGACPHGQRVCCHGVPATSVVGVVQGGQDAAHRWLRQYGPSFSLLLIFFRCPLTCLKTVLASMCMLSCLICLLGRVVRQESLYVMPVRILGFCHQVP